MNDWFGGFFSLLLLCFGITLVSIVINDRQYVSYQFDYSYTENIETSEVVTRVEYCVYFNPDDMSLDDAKRRFLSDYPVVGTLRIKENCDKNAMGFTIHKQIDYSK